MAETSRRSRRILYVVSSRENPLYPLYSTRLMLQGRRQTYGQHSFIYDLIATLARGGWDVDLLLEGHDEFPLAKPLSRYCRVLEADRTSNETLAHRYHCALLDETPDGLLPFIPDNVPTLRIVHHAGSVYSPAVIARCTYFVCMSENSFRRHVALVGPTKARLIHQGVDLVRFRPDDSRVGSTSTTSVLLYSRLETGREVTLLAAARELAPRMSLTVLGDGGSFWGYSDEIGQDVVLINHIPAHSIHNFLPQFQLVLSTGRGAMEALACGIPVILAGQGYGGVLTSQNIGLRLEFNLTGVEVQRSVAHVHEDAESALKLSKGNCRGIAENRLSMDRFVNELLALLEKN
jgi:glycosyltransferase involved in cell wall biosynthesis